MRNYKTKSKVFGYHLGLNNDNLYVCVPSKYFDGGQSVNIICEDIKRLVIATDREQEVTLKDKFDQDSNYKLYYFKIKEYSI